MPVPEQDTFSNISWHSEQPTHAAGPSTSAPGEPANSPSYSRSGPNAARTGDDHQAALEPGHAGGEILECTVSEPRKENDGTKDAYVSYLITTNVGLRAF